MKEEEKQTFQQSVWQWVNAIPVGKVATYGQIATLAGSPQHSRLVGRTLKQLPKATKLPWHRVINSQGQISNPNGDHQKERLANEGVTLINGRVSLKIYQWDA